MKRRMREEKINLIINKTKYLLKIQESFKEIQRFSSQILQNQQNIVIQKS